MRELSLNRPSAEKAFSQIPHPARRCPPAQRLETGLRGVRFGRKVDFRTCRRPPAAWANASAAAGRLRLERTLLLPATAIHNYLKIPVDTVPMI